MASDRDQHVVIVDGVRYRKEDAPESAKAPNKARTTGAGSGSTAGDGGKAATK